ncbi:MAG: PKD domain-containing protein [Candidatus Thermoplasmatota archaeon]
MEVKKAMLQDPIHIYSEVGKYTVTLTVTDSALYEQNQDTVTANVTIEDEENQPELSIIKPEDGIYVNDDKRNAGEK